MGLRPIEVLDGVPHVIARLDLLPRLENLQRVDLEANTQANEVLRHIGGDVLGVALDDHDTSITLNEG